MRILYVTPSFQGVSDIILNKSKKYSGLPPFVKVLEGLRNDGHVIDFVLFTKDELGKYDFLDDKEVTLIEWSPSKIKKNPIILLKTYKIIEEKIRNGNYDFVYSHGTQGSFATIAANRFKVPNGQRLYGVYPLYKEILSEKKKWSILLRKPLYFLSLYLKKSFLLVTNDGTKGGDVYKKLGPRKKKYKFHCWTNGVDRLPGKCDLSIPDVKNSLFYPGRIDAQKRHLYVLEIIEEIKKNIPDIKVYFGGSDQSQYAKEVKKVIEKKKLQNNAIIMGSLNRNEMGYLFNNSLATLLLYDVSNKGNTSLEALKNGSIIITEKNTGLDEFISEEKTGYFIKDANDIVTILKRIKNNPDKHQKMKEKVIMMSNEKLNDWDTRVGKELALIYDSTSYRSPGNET